MADQLSRTLVGDRFTALRFDGCEQSVLLPLPPVLNDASLEYVEQLAFTRQLYTVLAAKPVSVVVVPLMGPTVVQAAVVLSRYCTV